MASSTPSIAVVRSVQLIWDNVARRAAQNITYHSARVIEELELSHAALASVFFVKEPVLLMSGMGGKRTLCGCREGASRRFNATQSVLTPV